MTGGRGKRPMVYDSDDDDNQPAKKKSVLSSLQFLLSLANSDDALKKLLSVLEPYFRELVRDELRAFSELWNFGRANGASPSHRREERVERNLHLQFRSSIPTQIYAGNLMQGEQGGSITVALVDPTTGNVVNSGPGSSLKLNVVVVRGDFNVDEENWKEDEFTSSLEKQREGKPLLLRGPTTVRLKHGIGHLGDLSFTDNSSWTSSGMFRLGVMSTTNGVGIREGVSNAFVVGDKRAELDKKHYPPKPNDELYRLKYIGKNGVFHNLLKQIGIVTVWDFVQLAAKDPQGLRSILGPGMKDKMWKGLINHARTCDLSNELQCPNSGQIMFSNYHVPTMATCSFSDNVMQSQNVEMHVATYGSEALEGHDMWNQNIEVHIANYENAVLEDRIMQNQYAGLSTENNEYDVCGGTHTATFALSPELFDEVGGIAYGYTLPRPRADSVAAELSYCEEVFLPDTNEQADLQDSGNSCRSSAHACGKSAASRLAQRKWKRVSSVLKVFSLWRPRLWQDEDFLLFLDEKLL